MNYGIVVVVVALFQDMGYPVTQNSVLLSCGSVLYHSA